ncbi:hypothetical protein [Sphaerisporangium sp. TRM90804]|uniref:hypothetical protein n=1 Tax=Sphaerisporangium sp. TRM90804 TaxID=3031113 RepID=UPI002447D6D5|nr:hypothetical protein [Sphaerisporangium sp. TRM90804]MDH2424794.1 hypothetical protein [Sphaerisporangium sp. TRM90804]
MTATLETTASAVPAERLKDGHAAQRVNVYRDGVFLRQTVYPGTIAQAKAWATLQTMHDTHPDYLATLGALCGE